MSADSRRTEPTPAERARSVLAAAGSLTVTTEAHRTELIGLHTVGHAGQLTLDDPPGSHLRAELAHAPRGDLAAVVEFTDIAPTAVRDRVRARLTLAGYLTAIDDEPGALRFNTARAALAEAGQVTAIGLDELALARPDPLATYEADLLTHLDTTRTDTAARLSRLVPARLLLGVTRVRPVRLDRYGLVLRLERTTTHDDARLAFPSPVSHPGQAMRQMRSLLAQAATCPRRRRLPSRP
ncbi:DUF2470 domain-containing protein [Streptomyces sp. KR80]|uniref:DUF2470 domain-containing protein n=1 Tax=Streptomyces sp. KR80 TaxID=3457426 RepID=UPI003FD38078